MFLGNFILVIVILSVLGMVPLAKLHFQFICSLSLREMECFFRSCSLPSLQISSVISTHGRTPSFPGSSALSCKVIAILRFKSFCCLLCLWQRRKNPFPNFNRYSNLLFHTRDMMYSIQTQKGNTNTSTEKII